KIKSKGEYDEVAQAMESAGVVSFDDPQLFITGENKFFTDRLRKCLDVIKEALKEEFKREISLSVYEKTEYNEKYRAQKDVLEEEAKNHPAVKELSKVFKFDSIEIKKKPK
ncbi:MAG: hypothetical protein LLG37_07200, partial [Spirochaetia bacterium]|nr:hypothetical protein [Spirochaetia bacterium]